MDKDDVLETGLEHNAKDYEDAVHVIEAVLRERRAKLFTENGSVTDVNYRALDVFELFMERNYCRCGTASITEALSKRVLESKPNKDVYWRYASFANAVPGMIEEKEIRELLNILRAYKLIDCDNDGLFFVTEYGKKITDEAIIALDASKD